MYKEKSSRLKKQSNEEKDGHILLVLITDQKKLHIQTMRRRKKSKAEADQCELGLNDQILLFNSKLSISEARFKAEKAEAETRVAGTLQEEVTTLQDRVKIFSTMR
jgi:hypothetical protein